jgi:hypothetical protein
VLPVIVGPPVGLLPGERYAERELWLERDALIIVATDGIGDALMTDGDPLGVDALEESIQRAPRDPDRLCAFLFEAAARVGFKDDATVVAVDLGVRAGRRWSWDPVCGEHSRRVGRAMDERFESWWRSLCAVRLANPPLEDDARPRTALVQGSHQAGMEGLL